MWEYRVIVIDLGLANDPRPSSARREGLRELDASMLNTLGADGWELVAALPAVGFEAWLAFKRLATGKEKTAPTEAGADAPQLAERF